MNDDASGTVFLAVLTITGTTVLRRVEERKEALSVVVYGFILLTVLLFIAALSPRLATWLSYLGIVGAISLNASAVTRMLGGLSESGPVGSFKAKGESPVPGRRV